MEGGKNWYVTFCNIKITAWPLHCAPFHALCAVLPASCTFSTALVISAFKASVSSAETEAVTGTTANTLQNKQFSIFRDIVTRYIVKIQQIDEITVTDLSAEQLHHLPGWWLYLLRWQLLCWAGFQMWMLPCMRQSPPPCLHQLPPGVSSRLYHGGQSWRGSADCPRGWSLGHICHTRKVFLLKER